MEKFFNWVELYFSSEIISTYLNIAIKVLIIFLIIVLLCKLITGDSRKRKQTEREIKIKEREARKKLKLQNDYNIAMKQKEIERLDKQMELIKKQSEAQDGKG